MEDPNQDADAYIEGEAAKAAIFKSADPIQAIKYWSEDDIPKNLNNFNPFWGLATKELIFSRLELKRDRPRISNRMAILKNMYIMSLPSYQITPELMLQLENVTARILEIRVPRADQGFERTIEATNILSMQKEVSLKKPPGFFSKISNKVLRKRGQ